MPMKMEAVKMYAPGDLRLEETDVPAVKENEALVKVMAVGVCGSDIPRINELGAHISPIIPGHEFSGEIVALGAGISGFAVGEKVTAPPLMPCYACKYCVAGHYSLCEQYNYFGSRCDGAFAQYVAVPQSNLVKIAPNVTYEAAATADPLANALHSVKRGRFTEKDRVCVFGVGPIGLYALQYMKHQKCAKLIAVDVDDAKLKIAKACGADVCVNPRECDPVQCVRDNTDGQGVDLALDTSGVPAVQHQAILSLDKLGRMVFLGISHKPLDLTEQAVDKIMRHELELIGSWNSFSKPFPGWEWTHGAELLRDGAIDAKSIITHRLPLKDAPDTFKKIAKKELQYSKIIFFPFGVE